MAHEAYLEITQESLAELLDGVLPKNAKLVTIRINTVNDNLVLILEHQKFPASEGIQRVHWKELPKVQS